MRLTNSLRLLALCLVAGALQASGSPAMAKSAPSGPKKVVIKQEFQGYGLTPKDCEANALDQACDWLSANSNLGWTPTPEFLREKNMVQFGEPAETEKEFEIARQLGGHMKVVTMQLEITEDQARDIQKHARQERMVSRHLLLARILGGVVCLLIVVGAYLRLEEATKGYYTRLLRLTAIAILIGIGAGLLLVG
ncbi:MAG TPA: hypothetical protein VH643_05535 [Gemmataceae bacterium]|jgi:hypothetical protein